MSPSTQVVVANDGHRFELRHFAGVATPVSRPGLLFLPALGVPAQKYDAFAAQLAAAGVDVVVHEWRGSASSSVRAARDCDWGYRQLLGEDLAAVLGAIGPAPRLFGGHSLGGQFAAMLAARHPDRCAGLALVASGVPFPPAFAPGKAWALRAFARMLPPLVRLVGHFPGRRLRFAGREAAGVMRDWAATTHRGRYADYGDGEPMEAMLARLDVPALAVTMDADWLAPPASTEMLLAKLGGGPRDLTLLDDATLGVAADHFAWLRRPDAVVGRLLAGWPALSS